MIQHSMVILVLIFAYFIYSHVFQFRLVMLESDALTNHLHQRAKTAHDAMSYAIARTRAESLITFADGLVNGTYVYRGKEQELYDHLVKLYGPGGVFGTLVFGKKYTGKSAMLSFVLFNMAMVFDIYEQRWWVYEWILENEDYLTSWWLIRNQYDVVKQAANVMNSYLASRYHERRDVPLLDSEQLTQNNWNFSVRYGSDTHELDTSMNVYFVTFYVELTDDGLCGSTQIMQQFNMNGV